MWSPIRGAVDVRSSILVVRVLGRGFKGVLISLCDERGVFLVQVCRLGSEHLGFFLVWGCWRFEPLA